jgi:hypothetical protein
MPHVLEVECRIIQYLLYNGGSVPSEDFDEFLRGLVQAYGWEAVYRALDVIAIDGPRVTLSHAGWLLARLFCTPAGGVKREAGTATTPKPLSASMTLGSSS